MSRCSRDAKRRLLRNTAFALATILLGACGRGHGLPVEIKQCDTVLSKNSVLITARIFNGAQIPVKAARVSLDFYHDFRFTRVSGVASFRPQLEPNQSRSVPVVLTTSVAGIGGQAQRCSVDHVDYADGTSADTQV
jgi:hypothetical protein